ncbi:hypothetical protein Y032_0014g2246 [Ancylostoma ceylanicum]|uniref:Nucleotide-diphospho-sugar transferase domain-containing protein n=1 Tax=Ancylostoma ceylanicum TaxID=53326 RepID=A0A016V964_9BILA|nr:hypothetical protein Y032_0014g2246 [Ancylostoma ceylanicum]
MLRLSHLYTQGKVFHATGPLGTQLNNHQCSRSQHYTSQDLKRFEYVVEEKLERPLMNRSPRIAILVVIEADTELGFYEHAMSSVACYVRIWKYEFRIVSSNDYQSECPHKDKFFRRHCIVARILGSYDYLLFLDGDIGVVNPKRRIEDFLDADAEIIFYDRFYNWEVMAGAYLAKNSNWTKRFLDGFANYEFRLPKSFHGTDNGALHVSVYLHTSGRFSLSPAYLAEVILGSNHDGLDSCLRIYGQSRDFDDLFMYEACIRELLGNSTHFGPIKILRKGTAWARDNWITNSLWNPERDFMMHNWKLPQMMTYKHIPLPYVLQVILQERGYNAYNAKRI